VVLTLAESDSVVSSIANEIIEENGFKLEIESMREGNVLRVIYTFTCDRTLIRIDEFEAVKKTLKKMNKKLKQQIEIKQIN
jgi:hypothetical protein